MSLFGFSYPSVLFVCSLSLVGCTSCVCCHFLSSAGVWATESKGDHSGSARQLDSGSRCGALLTSSPPEPFLLQLSLFLSENSFWWVMLSILSNLSHIFSISQRAKCPLRREKTTSQALKFRWGIYKLSNFSFVVKWVKNERMCPFKPLWEHCRDRPCSSLPQEPIRPLEKRALNFLVNEYLLKNEYKLSSITFSDENDDQVKDGKCLTGVSLLFLKLGLSPFQQKKTKNILIHKKVLKVVWII